MRGKSNRHANAGIKKSKEDYVQRLNIKVHSKSRTNIF
jgi:hypothetical protein